MKKKIYNFLLLWMVVQTSVIGQITFKLKSVVGQQNPSANGLFSYGTFDGGGNFVLFPTYANDNTCGGGVNGQIGWTFTPGVEAYPFLAYQQLNACEITPQPFPAFGVFVHPEVGKPVVIKLNIPTNATINFIKSSIQRPSYGCGTNIGYSIKTNTATLLSRTIINQSSSPNNYDIGAFTINGGNDLYFVVDNGDDGTNSCDDTALDVEVSLQFNPILTPKLVGTLDCNTTSATFNVAYQSAGTLELYKLGNPNPIATTAIVQDGNTYNGVANFSGLNLYGGGQFYAVAKNVGQQESAQSELISVTPCCVQPVAPPISVSNIDICQGKIGTLTAVGCTGGNVSWSNAATTDLGSGNSISVSTAGTYTATCTVAATAPCASASSSASGIVMIKPCLVDDTNLTTVGNTISGDLKSNDNNPTNCPYNNPVANTNNPSASMPIINADGTYSFTPSEMGTYVFTLSVCCTGQPCATQKLTILVFCTEIPVPVITVNNATICAESSATLTATGCTNGNVTWLNSAAETIGTGNTISVNVAGTYTARCTIAGKTVKCPSIIGEASGVVTINSPVIIGKISVNDATICSGEKATLTVTGCNAGLVIWSNGSTGKSITVTTAGTYTATCRVEAIEPCPEGVVTASGTVTVLTAKAITVSTQKNVLVLGESTTLTSNCGVPTLWSNGEMAMSITVNPIKTTTYSAICNSPINCGGSGSVAITVNPPAVAIKANSVCYGDVATVSAENCSYGITWILTNYQGSVTKTGQSIQVPMYEKINVQLICHTSAGDGNTSITLEPKALPTTPTLSSSSTTLIGNQSTILTASGCNGTVFWSTGVTGNSITVSPRKTTTYSAHCVNGCASPEAYITITVKTPEAPVTDSYVCWGSDYVLNSGCPSGSSWYENWLDLATRKQLGEGEHLTIYEPRTFFVACDGEAGWSSGKFITVRPHARVLSPELPTLQTISKGDTTILKAVGCEQTQWQYKTLLETNFHALNSSENVISVAPQSSTVYQARCVNEAGCAGDWVNTTVLVRPKKSVVHVSQDTICVGKSIEIMAQCDGSTFKWIGLNDTNATLLISPLQDTTYKAVCIGTDSLVSDTTKTFIKVYQNPKKPTLSTLAKDQVIIEGESIQITARREIGSVTWSTGDTTTTIRVSPMKNTIYYATCTNWHCESDTSQITIRVRPKRPEITDGSHNGYDLADTLCLNKTLNLSVITGCHGTLVWDNGKDKQTGQSITITGIESSVYVVYCVNRYGDRQDSEVSDSAYAHITVLDYSINEVYVYPNPTVGKLFIQSKGCVDGVLLRLYTQRGELIYEGNGHAHYLDAIVLDLYHLPSETYILHIVGKDGTTVKKRVVKDNQE